MGAGRDCLYLSWITIASNNLVTRQAELGDEYNMHSGSKVSAARVLGRCHAAQGQHSLAVAALDAGIELARTQKLLLSEALSIRDRAGVQSPGSSAAESGRQLHWDKWTGNERLEEVMGRMQGARGALELVLLA